MGRKKGRTIGIQMERIRVREGHRTALLDELRGLAIISMIAYHFCYDMVMIFGADWPWFLGDKARLWQRLTAASFIVIAGICTSYSSRPYLRFLKVAACALLVTAATYFLYPDELVSFGVLHFLALSMLLWALFRRAFRCLAPWAGFIISVALAVLTRGAAQGSLGVGSLALELPGFLYRHYWLSPLGFPSPDYFSADYFPMLPWFFLFMAGAYMGGAARRLPSAFAREHVAPLAALGRYSLPIYMTHQVIIFGALSLAFRFLP